MKLVTLIIELICSFFKLKLKKETDKLYEKETESKKTLDERKQEVNDAVFNGDVDAINKILNTCIIVIFCLSCIGCYTEKVVYVESNREVKKMTYENVEGYFVPNIIMSELLQYKLEAKYYKDEYEKLKFKENIQ